MHLSARQSTVNKHRKHLRYIAHDQDVFTCLQASQTGQSENSPASGAVVISWDSFKALAKPGDRLRLSGDCTNLTPDGVQSAEGSVMPAGSDKLLTSDADVAAWGASADIANPGTARH